MKDNDVVVVIFSKEQVRRCKLPWFHETSSLPFCLSCDYVPGEDRFSFPADPGSTDFSGAGFGTSNFSSTFLVKG